MRDRELLIQREMKTCKHFRGTQHDTCAAGVNYRQMVGGPDLGWGLRLPCGLKMPHDKPRTEPLAVCEKRSHLTEAEAADAVDANERAWANVALASRAGGREYIEVSPRNSTRACSACGALTGPTGRRGLSVRQWACTTCGVEHDRDCNAAVNTLIAGRGMRHESRCQAASGTAS